MDIKKVNSLSVERDFNSRLETGEVEDLDSYMEYVRGKSHHFNVELNRYEHALQKIESRHYRSMANNREPPKRMIELLDEFIVKNNLSNKYNPSDIIDQLKDNEEHEIHMVNSRGEFNPYREML